MNKLLQCQLGEHFGGADKIPDNLRQILHVVSGTYDRFEKDQEMANRSSELSLKEMAELKTSLKKEKEELEISVSLLEATLESTADGILLADLNGKIVRFNKKFTELVGIPPEIMDTRDDEKAIAFVLDQLEHPLEFQSKVKELYFQKEAVSFDIVKFKDGRTIERYSQPQLINGNYVGRVWSFRDITERNIAQQVMTESEAKYRSFFENSPDGNLLTVRDGEILAVNPAACAIFQMTEEEVCKAGRFGLADMADPRIKLLIEERRRAGIAKGEITLTRKDGSKFPGELISAIFTDAFGQERTSMIIRDISDRKTAEQAIEKSIAFSKGLLDSLSSHIAVINASGTIIKVNKPWNHFALNNGNTSLNTFGEGANYFDVCNNPNNTEDEIAAKALDGIKKVINGTRKDFYLEYPCHSPEKENWFFMRVMKFESDETLVLIEHQSISERKQAEDKLKITSDRLQKALDDINKIMDSSLDVICAVDEQGYFLQVSAACETIWGYKASELIGKLMIDFVCPEDQEKTLKAAINVIAGNNMINFENRYIRKDGSLVPVNWSARWDSKEKIRYAVARDATEKKRTEKAFETERQRFNDMFLQAPSSMGMLKGPDHIYEMANPLYLQLIGKKDIIGKSVKEILPEVAEQGFIEILDGVYKTGKSFSANEMLIKLDKNGNGQLAEMYLNFIYQAYTNTDGNIEGIFFFVVDVTEQVISRKKIEESELRYRSLIEQATDAICISDPSMKSFDMNPSGCRMLGYSKEEFSQLSVADLIPPEDFEANPFKIEELRSGKTISNERRFKRKDGTILEVEINGKFLDDGRFIVYGRDITERKLVEKLIKESELRYRSLFEQATDAICIAGPSMKLYDINPSGSRLLGYSKEELVHLSVTDLFLPEDLLANPIKIVKLKSGETISNERRFKRKDGTLVDVEVNAQVLEDGRFIVFGRDITERKLAEKLIRESELRYRSIIEQATDAICIADSTMKFIDVNTYGCVSLGYTKEEALQLSVADILFIEDLAANPFKFHGVQMGEIIRNERRFKRKNGTSVIMEVSTRLMEDGRFIMFGHDVSNRKKSEEALRESEKRLRQIIDLVPHFIFAKDATGKFILANEAFARAYGSTVENLIGKSDADFNSHKEEVEHFMQEDVNVINSGNVKYNLEETITDAAGNILTLSTTKIPFITPEADAPGVLGVSVDITDRKKAEEQINLSNERYELVIKTTNDMIWDWDLVNNTIFRNENYSKVFGADAGDRNEVGKWVKRVHPDDKEWVEEYIRQKLEDPDVESWEVEFRYYRFNEEVAYLYDRGYIIRDENKKAIRMVGATSDITARKKAETQLKHSEESYRQIVETAQEGIWLIDESNYISFVNKKMCEILGYSADEIKGKRLFDFMDDEGREKALSQIELRKERVNGNYDVKYITKIGNPVWTNISTNSIFDDDGNYKGALAMVTDITERKKTEEGNRLKAELLNTVGQSVIATDLNGIIHFWNRAAEEIFGWAAEEAIGKNIIELTPVQQNKEQAIEIMHELSLGRSWSGEFMVKRKDDTIFPAFVTNSPIYDQHNKLSGIIGVSSDITQRKKTEEAISNNELRFRTLTANAPVGIFQTDIEGKTIYVNETWLSFTGMKQAEALGYGWMEAVHGDDRTTLATEWENKFKTGRKSSSEYRLVNKNGSIMWVSGEAVPLFNNVGEITGHIGTLSDITDRKNAEAEIKRSEERYRQIVETAQEGIWVTDENNYTIFVNKKMCEMLGYPENEILGRQKYFFKEDEKDIKTAGLAEQIKAGIKESHDASYVTKSGNTVWGHVSSNPIYNDDGSYKGALAMITDITRRKHDEELLRRSEADLEIKNKELEFKNKELEQFAYVASHDMQEPLRTTSSFVELLQKQYKGRLDEKADKYLNFIAQSSDRMKVLIKDLLDYSRIGRKRELAKLDCNIMLQEVLADLGTAIKESQAHIDAGPLPVINGYTSEIKQLFQNLVMNAIKFRKPDVLPEIKISVFKSNDNWEFIFKDNGIGIDEQHRERIFIIFQRLHTRNEYEGSGIGLAHCKKIVELHGGRIWVEPLTGQGSAFHFTIPKYIN